jgi:hypothetical protein
MRDLGRLIWSMLLVLLRSRAALAAENLVLRHQINVLRRTAPERPFLSNVDRLIFVCLYRLFPAVRNGSQLGAILHSARRPHRGEAVRRIDLPFDWQAQKQALGGRWLGQCPVEPGASRSFGVRDFG